jgi:hypothetical protein
MKLTELNKRRMAWIEMLESGKLDQTDGKLREGRSKAYCCLGVACELYRQEVGGKWNKDGEFFPDPKNNPDEYSNTLLPPTVAKWFGVPVAKWFGVHDGDADVDVRIYPTTASGMNDSGKDFVQIATALRKKFRFPKAKSADR